MAKVLGFFSKRDHAGITCKGGLTQQHFKDDCDLNVIIKRYPDGLPQPVVRPSYGDFTALGKGLMPSMEAYQFVSDWFSSLPSDVREMFDNDPFAAQRFVLDTPDQAVALGILSPSMQNAGEAGKGAKEKGAVAEPPPAATSTPATVGAAAPGGAAS